MIKKLITRNTLIGEIVAKYPQAAEMMIFDYGLHCVGCGAAGMETLEEGAMAHGLSKKEVETLVGRLNELVEKKGGAKPKR